MNSSIKPAVILYFVEGPAPKADDFLKAASLNATVKFRNALAVDPDHGGIEPCDGVAGAVPPVYAKAFPSAEDAIAKKASELKALAAKVGDAPVPKKGKDKEDEATKTDEPPVGKDDHVLSQNKTAGASAGWKSN